MHPYSWATDLIDDSKLTEEQTSMTFDLARIGREKTKKTPKKRERWKAPDEGVIKINTDASFLDTTM
jgi:hypothetical protein